MGSNELVFVRLTSWLRGEGEFRSIRNYLTNRNIQTKLISRSNDGVISFALCREMTRELADILELEAEIP